MGKKRGLETSRFGDIGALSLLVFHSFGGGPAGAVRVLGYDICRRKFWLASVIAVTRVAMRQCVGICDGRDLMGNTRVGGDGSGFGA